MMRIMTVGKMEVKIKEKKRKDQDYVISTVQQYGRIVESGQFTSLRKRD